MKMPPRKQSSRKKFFCVSLVLTFLTLYFLFPWTSWVSVGAAELNTFLIERGWRGCILRSDPVVLVKGSNSVKIVWDTTCPNPTSIQLGTDLSSLEEGVHPREADMQTISPQTHVHSVTVDVEPDTTYFYFLLFEGTTSPVFSFRTPASKIGSRETRNFALISDSQNGNVVFHRLLERIKNRDPDALFHLGDKIQNYRETSQWYRYWSHALNTLYYTTWGGVIKQMPILEMAGNHDGSVANNPYTHKSSYWSITVAGIHCVFLNSLSDSARQKRWFHEEIVSESWRKANLRVLLTHIPPYIEYWEPIPWEKGEKNWGKFVREYYLPHAEAEGLDLVLGGHTHMYQRGCRHRHRQTKRANVNAENSLQGMILPGDIVEKRTTVYADEDNVCFMSIGGGGGQLELESQRVEDWKVFTRTVFEHHYVDLKVEDDHVTFTVRDINDYVLDTLVFEFQ
eukprot:TRINITY_DN150_c1_g3_i1.p1 TRINITY_DN150_c1_g3~~TRINITY_DN150_c1_g3_i1.p1  ORF type:complete len:453 (-),score=79.68 TRINITY_DN150_c1_g3_i1:86-1444(-)